MVPAAAHERPAPPAAPATYARVADLPLRIERCELHPLVRDTTSGFTKVSLVVRLHGGGHVGEGEDVTWDQVDQLELLRAGGDLSWLHGTRTLDELSTLLGLANLFPVAPIRPSARFYRRWAFESAALDLALRQAGLPLSEALGRRAEPVRFAASIRIGDPPSLHVVHEWLERDPGLRLKLDPTPGWDDATVAELAGLGCVDVLDLKGRYRDLTVAMEADPVLYERVVEGLPDAWIEDPAIVPGTRALLARHAARVTWDEPVHGVADIDALPWEPRMLNVKPARFGSVRALFDAYDHCAARGIGLYGGGMFEQGPGRGQLQLLASLFHPDGPNDLAPVAYNLLPAPPDLPRSPLAVEADAVGFRWGSYDGRRSIREAHDPEHHAR